MTKVRLDVMSGVSALLGPGSWELGAGVGDDDFGKYSFDHLSCRAWYGENLRCCGMWPSPLLQCLFHSFLLHINYSIVLVEKDHRSKWKPLQGLNQY